MKRIFTTSASAVALVMTLGVLTSLGIGPNGPARAASPALDKSKFCLATNLSLDELEGGTERTNFDEWTYFGNTAFEFDCSNSTESLCKICVYAKL